MEHNIDTTIQFSGLKPGNYNYQFTLNDSFFSEYKNEKILGGEVVFDVKMEKKERLMMFYFAYSGKVLTTCDRCLGEIEWPIEGTETLCVRLSDTETSDDEEVAILPTKAFKIDLAQWMYEYVAVAMPIQCIHPDDENGQPTCDPEMMKYIVTDEDEGGDRKGKAEAENEETDPRWEALKNLK